MEQETAVVPVVKFWSLHCLALFYSFQTDSPPLCVDEDHRRAFWPAAQPASPMTNALADESRGLCASRRRNCAACVHRLGQPDTAGFLARAAVTDFRVKSVRWQI